MLRAFVRRLKIIYLTCAAYVRNSGLEDSRLSFQRQSLKSFRRVEMAQVWREGLGFERNK